MGRWLAIGAALLMGFAGSPYASSPDPDLSAIDPGQEALRRIQSRTGILLPQQAFPIAGSELRTWMDSAGLSPSDSVFLIGRYPFSPGGLFNWRDSTRNHSFRFAPLLEATAIGATEGNWDGGGNRAILGLGARIEGGLGPRLTWYTHALAYTEKADSARYTHQFDPGQGETYSVEKGAGDSLLDYRTYNRFEYYVKYEGDGWAVKAGRDRVHMGPGYFSSLTAERSTPPYYMAEARIDFAPWLRLDDYLLKMTDTDHSILKYANLHRLEFKPTRWLSLAYQDIVIYQDRDPDPAYLLPFVPLTFSEANNGGRDNAAMAFDFMLTAPRGLSLWGEVFLDDLVGPGSFFDDFWENRWASLAGFQWVLPQSWADADLIVEYSHVEPWTYNGRQAQTSFRHFNVPSASKLGPDSRSLDAQVSWRPFRFLQASSRGQWNEKGTGRQATLGVIHEDGVDGFTKRFLADARSTWLWTQEVTALKGNAGRLRAWWSEGWGRERGRAAGVDLEAGW